MEDFRKLSTREKALKINLDTSIYGSFAEIGAGQEVAAHFFKAGGSSGTVAQTISAYDMKFSDSLYGHCDRYVCEERLHTMINREYDQLHDFLAERANRSKFFTIANTIETLNYFKTNDGHGWMGVRFQLQPNAEANECVLHFVMKDNDTLQQQEAVGIVGVNLLYACHFNNHDMDEFINSLVDGLAGGRVEIDMMRLTGPDFEHIDNRLLALKLVKNGLTLATMFSPDGNVLQASTAMYKKNILVLRGRFRPITHVNIDMYKKGLEQFTKEAEINADNIIQIFELTLKDLSADGSINDKDFLDRAEILCKMGHTVMISNYHKYYTLVSYLSNSVRGRKIGVILGINNLKQIFDDRYYDALKGRLLESLGILFGRNVKVYVYPAVETIDGKEELITTENFEIEQSLRHILNYLKENNKIEDLLQADTDHLHIYSDLVLQMLREGKEGWEEMVPEIVADMIKEKQMFNYSTPNLTLN